MSLRMLLTERKHNVYTTPLMDMLNLPVYQGFCFFKILWHLNWIEEDDDSYSDWWTARDLVIDEIVKARVELTANTTERIKVYNCILGIMTRVKMQLSGINYIERHWLAIYLGIETRMKQILNWNCDIYEFNHRSRTIHCIDNMRRSNWINFYTVCHNEVEFPNYSIGQQDIENSPLYQEINQKKCFTYGEAINLIQLIEAQGRTATDLKKYIRHLINLKFGIESKLPKIGIQRRIRFIRWANLINEITPIKPRETTEGFFYEPEFFEAERKLKLINDVKKYISTVTFDDHVNNQSDYGFTTTTDEEGLSQLKNMGIKKEIIKIEYKFLGQTKEGKTYAEFGGNKVDFKYKIKDNYKEGNILFYKHSKSFVFYKETNPSYIEQIKKQKPVLFVDKNPLFPTKIKIFLLINGVVYFTLKSGIVEDKKYSQDEDFDYVKPRRLKKKEGKSIKPQGNELKVRTFNDHISNLKKVIQTEDHWIEVKNKSKVKIERKPNFVHINKFEALPIFAKTEFKINKLLGLDTIKMNFESFKKKPTEKNALKKYHKELQKEKQKIYDAEKRKKELSKRNSNVDKLNKNLRDQNSYKEVHILEFVKGKLFNKNNTKLAKLNYESLSSIYQHNYCKKDQLNYSHSKRNKLVHFIKELMEGRYTNEDDCDFEKRLA